MSTKIITFQHADLIEFSNLSGDVNPLHLDQAFSSRTKFRKPIVYGIHSFISALNLFHQEKISLSTLKLSFLSPVYTSRELTAFLEQNFEEFTLTLSFGNLGLIRAIYTLNYESMSRPLVDYHTTHTAVTTLNRDIGEIKVGESFRESIYLLTSSKKNPSISRSCLTGVQLAILYSCSRISGMRVAGGNGVLSSLELNFSLVDTAKEIIATTNMVSYGTRMVEIGLRINPKVTLGTILLQVLTPRPIGQSTPTLPINNVQAFSGKTTLITGASRGIGAGFAEAFASRGSNLILHYAYNTDLAKTLQYRLERAYNIVITLIKADLTEKSSSKTVISKALSISESVDYVIHSAFPGTHKSTIQSLNYSEITEQMHFSVASILEMIQTLLFLNNPCTVLGLSTTYINHRTRQFFPYVLGKVSLELLFEYLSNELTRRGFDFKVIRSPQVNTDLHAGVEKDTVEKYHEPVYLAEQCIEKLLNNQTDLVITIDDP